MEQSLEKEKETTTELRKRFEDAQDALEYEQMSFEKEKQSLQQLLTDERKQLKYLEGRFQQSTKQFESTHTE